MGKFSVTNEKSQFHTKFLENAFITEVIVVVAILHSSFFLITIILVTDILGFCCQPSVEGCGGLISTLLHA